LGVPSLIAYTDRWSARPGDCVALNVSCAGASYQAELVRIRSADPNPDGPGQIFESVPAAFAGSYPGRRQAVHGGSRGLLPLDRLVLPEEWTLSVRVQPWLLDGRPQAVLAWTGGEGLCLHVTATGAELRVGAAVCRVAVPMLERRWYELRVIHTGGSLRLLQIPLTADWGVGGGGEARVSATPARPETMLIAAAPGEGAHPYRDHLNGRVEHPLLLAGVFDGAGAIDPASLPATPVIAWWDFSLDIPTQVVSDRGPHRLHGRLENLPTRAVRGAFWCGDVLRWSEAPDQYAAVHFHDDDLYDCGWETDFWFDVPAGLPSGVYGIRLRSDPAEIG
jgi:N,N-dimethylformamidase